MPKPLAKYVGGKVKLAEKIIQIMPPHRRYVEGFAGMASVFLAKPKARENVINDINSNLVNLFEVARDNPEELIRLIELTHYARHQYNEWWALYFDRKTEFNKLPKIKRAVIYIYLLHAAFNAQMENHKSLDWVSFSVSGAWGSDGMLRNIREWSKYMQGTVFTNWDYAKVLDKFCDSETLVYLDPPYVVAADKNYYEINFTETQHKELAAKILEVKNTTGANFILSYDDVQALLEFYKDPVFHVHKFKDVGYSSTTGNTGEFEYKDELVITTYDIKTLGLFWQ